MSAARFAERVNAGTVDQHLGRFHQLGAAGVQTAIVSLPDVEEPEAVARFGRVIAALALSRRAQRAATRAISTRHSGRARDGTRTSVDAGEVAAEHAVPHGHHRRQLLPLDDVGRHRHHVLCRHPGLARGSCRRFAHTTSACSASPSGTCPSGAMGTTPEVWRRRSAPTDSTAWLYRAAGGAMVVGETDVFTGRIVGPDCPHDLQVGTIVGGLSRCEPAP